MGFLEIGDNEKAATALGRAVAIRPDMANYQYSLAIALQGAGKSSQAETTFRTAISLAPNLAPALLGLAQVLLDTHKWEESANWARKAV